MWRFTVGNMSRRDYIQWRK